MDTHLEELVEILRRSFPAAVTDDAVYKRVLIEVLRETSQRVAARVASVAFSRDYGIVLNDVFAAEAQLDAGLGSDAATVQVLEANGWRDWVEHYSIPP